ncbi:MAG: hypothetical protein K0U13_04845 [Chlamydiae bacterium]|nr:hypothetical protein [Chlamydiota bacterium]
MNATIDHPKLVAIPIGAEGMAPSPKESFIQELLNNPQPRETLLYINFRPDNHHERTLALDYFGRY